jgi:hypothetical protein
LSRFSDFSLKKIKKKYLGRGRGGEVTQTLYAYMNKRKKYFVSLITTREEEQMCLLGNEW